MRTAIVAAVMAVSMGMPFSVAMLSAQTSPPPSNKASSDQLLKRALDRPLPEIRFSGSSLSDCIDFLSDATSVNIVVDWKALEAVKVTKDTPVTLRLS